MNDIELLQEKLTSQFLGFKATLDRPALPRGDWFLDAELHGKKLVVVWSPERGFALSARDEVVFGEAPDERFPDANSAFLRARELLAMELTTSSPIEAWHRVYEGLSDEEIAEVEAIALGRGARPEGSA